MAVGVGVASGSSVGSGGVFFAQAVSRSIKAITIVISFLKQFHSTNGIVNIVSIVASLFWAVNRIHELILGNLRQAVVYCRLAR